MKLRELGLQLPDDAVQRAVTAVNDWAVTNKRGMSDAEFADVAAGLGGHRA